MKRDIILSGVGGQGILSIATVIGRAALDQGLHIKQAEVHGMSQRGMMTETPSKAISSRSMAFISSREIGRASCRERV